MNQVFDLNRWLLLTGKHWNENKKKYLLGLVAIAALAIIWFSFRILVGPEDPMKEEQQLVTYHVGLYVIGCLYASLLFSDLADGPKGIHYLLVPASALEKLLTAILFGVILYFICYTVVFYVVDFTMIKVANGVAHNYWEQHQGARLQQVKVINIFTGFPDMANNDILIYLMLIFVAVQAAFLLGSVYFPKYSFIKTAISLLVIFLIGVFYVHNVLGSMMPKGHFYEGMGAYKVFQNGQDRIVSLPSYIGRIVGFLLMYSFAPIFWLVTYFRLKEKEV
jgi:hypothetical protein